MNMDNEWTNTETISIELDYFTKEERDKFFMDGEQHFNIDKLLESLNTVRRDMMKQNYKPVACLCDTDRVDMLMGVKFVNTGANRYTVIGQSLRA